MGSFVLLDLMGGVPCFSGLQVLTGVLRAFGPHLRRKLSKALGLLVPSYLTWREGYSPPVSLGHQVMGHLYLRVRRTH
jgi:hypothetical protein